jgi:hypothetical protein
LLGRTAAARTAAADRRRRQQRPAGAARGARHGGHIVGYVDEQGLAWESLTERIVAVHGNRLAEALVLPYDDPRRDQLMDEVLADLPDELIAEVARAAGEALAIRNLAQDFDL